MNLQIMSDLHFEMHADGGAGFIRELDPTGVDVLVLAGDITMARRYEDLAGVFRPLAQEYPHILYVPGNHEYYKSSPTDVARNLAPSLPLFRYEHDTAVCLMGNYPELTQRSPSTLLRRRSDFGPAAGPAGRVW